MGSSFQRQGAAYRKERLVIFKEDRLGGLLHVVGLRRTLNQTAFQSEIAFRRDQTPLRPHSLDAMAVVLHHPPYRPRSTTRIRVESRRESDRIILADWSGDDILIGFVFRSGCMATVRLSTHMSQFHYRRFMDTVRLT